MNNMQGKGFAFTHNRIVFFFPICHFSDPDISDFLFLISYFFNDSCGEDGGAAEADVNDRLPEGVSANRIGAVAAVIPLGEETEKDHFDGDPADQPPVPVIQRKTDSPCGHERQPGKKNRSVAWVIKLIPTGPEGTDEHPDENEDRIDDH